MKYDPTLFSFESQTYIDYSLCVYHVSMCKFCRSLYKSTKFEKYAASS